MLVAAPILALAGASIAWGAVAAGSGTTQTLPPLERLKCGGELRSFGEASYNPEWVSPDTPETIAERYMKSEDARNVAGYRPDLPLMAPVIHYDNTKPAEATAAEVVVEQVAGSPIAILGVEKSPKNGWRLEWLAQCGS